MVRASSACALLVALASGCDALTGLSAFEVRDVASTATSSSAGGGAGAGGGGAGGVGGGGAPSCDPTVVWATGWIGTADQHVRGVVAGARGSLLAMGQTAGGDIDLGGGTQTATGAEIWIGRVDEATGTLQGGGLMYGSGDDLAQNIVRSQAGIFVGGQFSGDLSAGTTLGPAQGPTDGFVATVNDQGVPTAGHLFGGVGMERVLNLAVDDPGNVWVVGTYDNTGADPDAFVSRLDAAFDQTWGVTFGGDDPSAIGQEANGVAFDDAGHVYVTGDFSGLLVPPDRSAMAAVGAKDVWVSKLDANGAELWTLTIGSPEDDIGEWVAALPGGGAVVVGSFGDNIMVDDKTYAIGSASSNAFALGVADDGSITFFRPFDNDDVSSARGVAVGAAEAIYVAGNFSGTLTADGKTGMGYGGEDAFFARLALDGSVDCLFTFGGPDTDRGWQPVPLGDDVLLCGEHMGAVDVGGVQLPADDGHGALLVRLHP
jgi:hypothetical protein